MKTLIIGAGEIGSALLKVLAPRYETDIIDKDEVSVIEPEIIHICFPYSWNFIDLVREYQERYNPKYTVIHSTVPPGVSRQLGAVHSPVLGIHPQIERGIRTFKKFLSGENASDVADYFRRADLTVYIFDKQETTEAMKILDTTFYGVCLEYTKEVKRVCKELGIPFEAWTIWTDNYNEGYRKLDHKEFTRPNLTPIMQKIGGHCVKPNYDLMDTKFIRFMKELYEENDNKES
jgi:hypothetical protein